jgi:hypothetical protein
MIRGEQMTDGAYTDRKKLTFEQAEGAAPLPTQLLPKELTKELRARLWQVLYLELSENIERDDHRYPSYFQGRWLTILKDKYVFRDHEMIDGFQNRALDHIEAMKHQFSRGSYLQVFGLIQFFLRHPACPHDFWMGFEAVLRDCRAAYCIFDCNTIIPVTSDEDRVALERAFADVAVSEFKGARAHLRNAGSELSNGHYAASIRESIHAVESVARVLEPSAATLTPALAALSTKVRIHPALKSGFSNLYGYTSDEKGVRHALIDGAAADVDEADALYMLGACASFVSYLINKARDSGLLAT